jgi:hypothetical protein
MSGMNENLLNEVAALYNELPSLRCRQCGSCCVSPSCTLAEYIYCMDYALSHIPKEQLRTMIHRPPLLHPEYEGNMQCVFLHDSTCCIHPGRTGACRLFGVPSLSEFNIKDFVQCRHSVEIASGNADIDFIRSWLDRLTELNKTLYPFDTSPYYVKGFPLECWHDIYSDELCSVDVFATIRECMHSYLDLSEIMKGYEQKTGIKEKIDKVTLVISMLDTPDPQLLEPLLLSIVNDYPFTSNYYVDEAQSYLDTIRDARKNSE